MRSAVHRAGEEVEGLKDDEQAKIADEAYSEIETATSGPLCQFDLQAGDKIDDGDAPDDPDVAGAPAHVEVVAGDEQDDLAGGSARGEEEQPHHDKEQEELEAIEEHDAPSTAAVGPRCKRA